jgi:putative nucleotidyltransferase with HDIG domain
VELERANADILAMTDRLRESYHGTLEALVNALDARDRETKGHSSRVTHYTLEVARRMGIREGSPEWLDIQRGALLHDVGKIGVSDNILHKPGSLTDEEWEHMRRHPAIGYSMLKEVTFLSRASEIVYTHHERYDGKGYPRGLKGQEIPLGARIFAVADSFDAMTSDRPYRKAMSWQEARDEIARNSGTQFDPQVVKLFLQILEEWAAKDIIAEKRLAA